MGPDERGGVDKAQGLERSGGGLRRRLPGKKGSMGQSPKEEHMEVSVELRSSYFGFSGLGLGVLESKRQWH